MGKTGANDKRRGRLEHLTGVIKSGGQAFIKTGAALKEVRDGELYKGDYDDYDDYCRKEFEYSGRHADRQIRASRAATTLRPFGLDIQNEAQARVMARLVEDPETAARVWQQVAVESGGRHTAAQLARAIQRERGLKSPDPYYDDFLDGLEDEDDDVPPTPKEPRRSTPPRLGGVSRPMVRYYGSKWNLAPYIVEIFVDHRVYVEPYLGSAAVFLTKAPAKHEVLNDVDDEIVNLFEVIRRQPEDLAGVVGLTPTSETEVRLAGKTLGDGNARLDPLERARRFLVVSHQARLRQVGDPSYSAATGPTARNNVSLWNRIPDEVWTVAQRFKDADVRNTDPERDERDGELDGSTKIHNRDAISLIRENAYEDALVYVDPPYVPEKRAPKLYRRETPLEHHERLVKALIDHPGSVYLSGYKNDLYKRELEDQGWVARKMDDPGEAKEAEYLWLNAKAQVGARKVDTELARKKAEAEAKRARSGGMGMIYMPPPAPEPNIKPEVALFGALIGAYREDE